MSGIVTGFFLYGPDIVAHSPASAWNPAQQPQGRDSQNATSKYATLA